MRLKKASGLFRNTRAVNAVISNVILTGAVIAVGFVVLAWTQYHASDYNAQYGETMSSEIARLKERLTFEYVYYNRSTSALRVYLMNSGTISNVTIQAVYVSNATWFYSDSSISLKFFNGTSVSSLSKGSEGYFEIATIYLGVNSTYSVRGVTGRGSGFETTIIAQ